MNRIMDDKNSPSHSLDTLGQPPPTRSDSQHVMSNSKTPKSGNPADTDIHTSFVSHLRQNTKHGPSFLCLLCSYRAAFQSRDSAWNHMLKTHADAIPTDPQKVEEFKDKHLIDNANTSKPSTPGRRQAGLSFSEQRKRGHDQQAGRTDKNVFGVQHQVPSNRLQSPDKQNAQSDARDVSRDVPKDISDRDPRKKRAVGQASTPDSSVRTTSEVDYEEGSKNVAKTRSPPPMSQLEDPAFTGRPRAPNRQLYDPRTSPSHQRLQHPRNIMAHTSMNQSHRLSQTSSNHIYSPPPSSSPKQSRPSPGQRGVLQVASLSQGAQATSGRSAPSYSQTTFPSLNKSKPHQPHDDSRDEEPLEDPRLILQPVTRPISQEQLIAEVKGIYAGLVMVEGKCIQVDAKQTQLVKEAPVGQPPKLNNEQYQALIALHRTLLHEHHDFFLASQHPSATPGVRRLALKYAMPARLWKHGIHAFLELLRNRLPDSIEHMLAFIYLAYSMMTLLLETVPAFESTWIECLGDLARYRMAIVEKDPDDENDSEKENDADESDAEKSFAIGQRNDNRQRRIDSLSLIEIKARKTRKKRRAYNDQERETWTQVAFEWYVKASNSSPEVGRLYHHLAILSQQDESQQLFYYGKALVVPKPFEAARESILTLFRPVFGQRKWRHGALKVDKGFTTMHAVMFTRNELQKFDEELAPFSRRLGRYIENKAETFLEATGFHMAMANIEALVDYGKATNPLVKALSEATPEIDEEMSGTIPELDTKVFEKARSLFYATARAVFNRPNDKNILSYMHATLVWMQRVSLSPVALQYLEADFPWQSLATCLNCLLQSYSTYDRIQGNSIPMPVQPDTRPFREDFAMREIFWASKYYPQGFFDGKHIDREDQFKDNAAAVEKLRPERVLYLGAQIARRTSSLQYNPVEHRFLGKPLQPKNLRHDLDSTPETDSVTMAADTDDISMASVASA